HPPEDVWLEYVDPGEHDASEGSLDPGREPDDAPHPVLGIELDEAVARGFRVGPHDHRRHGAAGPVEGDDVLQVELEEAVAVHHHERLAREQWLGPLDAAARVEDRILPGVLDPEAEAAAVTDALLDRVAQVMEVDHHLADAAGVQELQDVLEQRPSRDRKERLRRRVGERREARTPPRGEHHGATDHAGRSSPSSGTQATSRAAAVASAGSARSIRRATP